MPGGDTSALCDKGTGKYGEGLLTSQGSVVKPAICNQPIFNLFLTANVGSYEDASYPWTEDGLVRPTHGG